MELLLFCFYSILSNVILHILIGSSISNIYADIIYISAEIEKFVVWPYLNKLRNTSLSLDCGVTEHDIPNEGIQYPYVPPLHSYPCPELEIVVGNISSYVYGWSGCLSTHVCQVVKGLIPLVHSRRLPSPYTVCDNVFCSLNAFPYFLYSLMLSLMDKHPQKLIY